MGVCLYEMDENLLCIGSKTHRKKTFDPLFKKKLLDYLISSKSLSDFHSILITHLVSLFALSNSTVD